MTQLLSQQCPWICQRCEGAVGVDLKQVDCLLPNLQATRHDTMTRSPEWQACIPLKTCTFDRHACCHQHTRYCLSTKLVAMLEAQPCWGVPPRTKGRTIKLALTSVKLALKPIDVSASVLSCRLAHALPLRSKWSSMYCLALTVLRCWEPNNAGTVAVAAYIKAPVCHDAGWHMLVMSHTILRCKTCSQGDSPM